MTAWSVHRDRDDHIEIVGDVRTSDAGSLWRTLNRRTRNYVGRLELDLSGLTSIDPVPVALLLTYRSKIAARGIECAIVNAPEFARLLFDLYGRAADTELTARPQPNVVERVGRSVASIARRGYEPLIFAGELAEGLGQAIRHPGLVRWRSVPTLLVQAGADAIAIVIVLDFLLGFVIALQSAPSLVQFGANAFVADLVGISVARELVPLMGAIIMSGRSGAAIAAELGTMHVSEEIDALQTMGISPIPYLVLPRIAALVIVAPMLVVVGDVAGITGGMVVAITSLDQTGQGYISELRTIVVASDVWTGMIKGAVFAAAIGAIACQEGLAARGAAAGVGRRTTATVVVSLFSVVVLDTFLTILFRDWGM